MGSYRSFMGILWGFYGDLMWCSDVKWGFEGDFMGTLVWSYGVEWWVNGGLIGFNSLIGISVAYKCLVKEAWDSWQQHGWYHPTWPCRCLAWKITEPNGGFYSYVWLAERPRQCIMGYIGVWWESAETNGLSNLGVRGICILDVRDQNCVVLRWCWVKYPNC